MTKRVFGVPFYLCIALVALAPAVGAFNSAVDQAQGCQLPAYDLSSEPNIFSEEQENDLGDAVAERLTRDFRVIDDAELIGPLQAIGARLMKSVPASRLRLQFQLIELPEVNAFVLPGGRVYVSRKLVSFANSEDELAGVMAHELGHLVTRQQTISISRQFKNVLGVTAVTDRASIFEQYHRLLDNAARNPGAFKDGGGHEGKDQIAADRVGIYLLAAAGYNPDAFASMYDRFAETKGKTGGFFSNLFGTTSPEARRLREVIKTTTALPAPCVEKRTTTETGFHRWQSDVVAYLPQPPKELLHNVVSRTPLLPPVRGDITHLKFSADGRFILAQDDSGITVLSHAPLSSVFRIHAPEAERAQFTPDSTRVVFHTSDLRVETWDVAARKIESAHEVVIRSSCFQTALAPDGKTLACVDSDFALTLVDVASGAVVYQKKQFFEPDFLVLLSQALERLAAGDGDSSDASLVTLGFSPDARYFAAGFRRAPNALLQMGGQESVLVYDLQSHAVIQVKGDARKFMATGFVFTAADRITAVNPSDQSKSAVIALPSAEIVEKGPMFWGDLTAATKGRFVFVRPLQKYAVGVMDVAKGQVTKGLTTPAIDIYDDEFVAERGTGELGLYATADNQLRGQATLPPAALGRLRASAASPDLRWLAVSERSRGAVFDLTQGRRVFFLRGFRAAALDASGQAVIDLPKFRDEDHQIARLDAGQGRPMGTLKVTDSRQMQFGALLLARVPDAKSHDIREGFTLELRDARLGTTLWTRQFGRDMPIIDVDPVSERVLVGWKASTPSIRSEIRKDPKLRQQLDALQEPDGDFIVQVYEGRTGRPLGTVFVETGKGSFGIVNAVTSGDWLAIQDNQSRTRIYSLSTGEMTGRVFGTNAVLHGGTSIMAVRNAAGKLTLHDAVTMAVRDELTFSQPIAFTSFNADGSRMLVVTSDHTAFVIDVTRH